MTRFSRFASVVAAPLAAVILVATAAPARAGNDGLIPGHDAQSNIARSSAKIEERIGAQVPMDLTLRDENDQPVTLGQAIAGRPTILVPVYYRCPMLCTDVLNGVLDAVRKMPGDYSAGSEFSIVTVSMDPKEHGDLARKKKQAYLAEYGRPGAENGWRFLTGTKENVGVLMDAVGYRFEFDKMVKEYDHPTGIVIVSPQGKVTRYIQGIGYDREYALDAPGERQADGSVTRPTTTLKLSLIEANEGKGGSLFDQITLVCYRYDRLNRGYSLSVLTAVRIGGLLTLGAVALGVGLAFLRERRRRAARSRAGSGDQQGNTESPTSREGGAGGDA